MNLEFGTVLFRYIVDFNFNLILSYFVSLFKFNIFNNWKHLLELTFTKNTILEKGNILEENVNGRTKYLKTIAQSW